MRILQVMAGAHHGGAETAFIDTCLALDDAGEHIEVITRPHPLRRQRLVTQGLTVHECRFGGVWDVYTPLYIKSVIKKFQPHIVQTWMSRASWKTPGWEACDSIPRYVTVARLGGYYKMKYFKNTDYFAAITPDIRRYLIHSGIEKDRVHHINNFADLDIAKTPVKRADLETPEDAVVLLALGRLHHAKAFDVLQKAIQEIPDVYLWIAGDGPDRKNLQNLCKTLGLEARVRFLGWRDDRAALFQACDICVFPSRYEPFGTVFVQAWAQKKPLVTTASDGPRQYVRDGEDGLMVPIDNVQALQDAIGRLIKDQGLTHKLVMNGYQRYVNEFTREKMIRSYLTFYHQILNRHQGDLTS